MSSPEELAKELAEAKEASEKLNWALNEKNKELALFFAVGRIVETEADSDGALESYLKSVCDLSDWPVGHIYHVVRENDEVILQPSSLWYVSGDDEFKAFIEMTQETTLSPGSDLPGQVLDKQGAIWIEDIAEDPEFTRFDEKASLGLHAACAVPISRYGEVVSVAEFFSRHPESEHYSFLHVIETAAAQLSTVLERRLSEQQLRRNFEKLQAVYEELKSTQSQLVQSSKLASIGQLAAGVAHEINNPVAFVESNVSVLKKYMVPVTEAMAKYQAILEKINTPELIELKTEIEEFNKKNNLDFIIEDIDGLVDDSIDGMARVADIVAGLKTFARVDEAETKEVNINECIDSTVKIVWNELKYKCVLDKQLGDIPMLNCRPSQLNQVFMNLLVNAAQAIEDEGEVVIKTYHDEKSITVEISDNGCGIPKENFEQLFDPFFTTKPIGTGTGLGLSISYGIIQNHNGVIELESVEGEGTTFKIILPLAGISETD